MVNMADYTALTVVKNLPKGIHLATATSRPIRNAPKMPRGAMPTRRSTASIRPTGRGERHRDHVDGGGRQEGQLQADK